MTRLEKLIEELCPNGVEKCTLSDVTLKFTDGMHNLPKTTMEISDYRILSAQNIFNGCIDLSTTKFVSEEVFKKENKRTDVKQGDVLLTIVGAIGRVAVVEDDLHALFQRSVCVIKPDSSKIISKYLQYVLESNSVQAFIKLNAHGAAQKGIYLKDVGKIPISLPPLEVQAEIVKILDDYSTSVTALQQELEKELTARKKQYEHYSNSLYNFDENIKKFPLAELADISTGSSNTNEAVENGEFPFYVRSQEQLRKDTYEYDETAIITAGDGVGVGKVFHYVEGKYALHQRAYRIHITSDKIMPKFYFYYMKNTFFDYISKTGFHSSVSSIRRPMLNNFMVPVPPLKEQERIVKILDHFDKLCNDISEGLPAEIEARQKQYEYYRDKLLTFKELI